ncbi:glycosyltransferase family 4 protein [Vibrio breoganii]
MKKALIYDPYVGHIAGAQKVTHNVIDFIASEYEVLVFLRNVSSQHVDKLKEKHNYRYISFESLIGKAFGKGTSDSNINNGLLHKFILLLSIIFSNFLFAFEVIKSKPKIVYTYDPRGLVLCGLFLKWLDCKVIWHLHGPLNYNENFTKFLLSIPDKVVVPSRYIKDTIIKYRADVDVIYNGFEFDGDKYKKSTELGIISLLYVGTLVPHKGLHVILEALRKVSLKDSTKIKLNVLGDYIGSGCSSYQEYLSVRESALPDKVSVVYHGWVTDPSIYYRMSDIVLFSSVLNGQIMLDDKLVNIRSSEALPTVLIEALSYRTPVIATDAPGVAEILTSSTDGIIIPESEPNNFKEAIEKMINNIEKFDVENEKTLKKFDVNNMKIKFLGLIE